MCCQVLLDLIFCATSCQCPFLTDLSRWFQAYNLRNTGISGIIFGSPQATLTTAFWNHEVYKWYLRTEATHGHTVPEVQVTLQVSNKYYVFIFLVFVRVEWHSLSGLVSFQNSKARTRSDADAAHRRKASGVMQMRQTRQMQIDEDANIRNWTDEHTSLEFHSLLRAKA